MLFAFWGKFVEYKDNTWEYSISIRECVDGPDAPGTKFGSLKAKADPLEPSQHAQFPAQKHPALYYAEKKKPHN